MSRKAVLPLAVLALLAACALPGKQRSLARCAGLCTCVYIRHARLRSATVAGGHAGRDWLMRTRRVPAPAACLASVDATAAPSVDPKMTVSSKGTDPTTASR